MGGGKRANIRRAMLRKVHGRVKVGAPVARETLIGGRHSFRGASIAPYGRVGEHNGGIGVNVEEAMALANDGAKEW